MNQRHTWSKAEENGGAARYRAVCVRCGLAKEWITVPFRRTPKFITYIRNGRTTAYADPCLESEEARTLPLPFGE